MQPETCSQCAARIDNGIIFCQKCGATLRSPTPLIAPSIEEVKANKLTVATRVVVTVVRGVAGIAAVIAVFSPLGTWTHILMFMASIVVLLICHFVLVTLDDNYIEEHTKSGYWPEKPIDWSPPSDRQEPAKQREKD